MGQSASQGRNVLADDRNDPVPSYMPAAQDDSNQRPHVKWKDRKGLRRSHTSNSAAEDGWASASASEDSEADAEFCGLRLANGGSLDHVNYLSNSHARNMVTGSVGLHSTYIATPSRRAKSTPSFQFSPPSCRASEKDNASMVTSTTRNAEGSRISDKQSLLEKGLAGNTATGQPTKTSHFPLFRGFLKGNNRASHDERQSFSYTPAPLNFHDPARPYTVEQLATRPPLLPTSYATLDKSRERPERVGDQTETVVGETGKDGGNSRVEERRPSPRSSASVNVLNSDSINRPTSTPPSIAQNPTPKHTKRDLESTLASPAARNRDIRGRWSADSTSTSCCARSESPCSKHPRYSANHLENYINSKPPETTKSCARRNVESFDGEIGPSDNSTSSSAKRTGDRLSRRRRLSVELAENPVFSSRPLRPVNRTKTQQPIQDPAMVNMKFDFTPEDEDSDDILTPANHTLIPRSGDIIDIDRSDDERRYETKRSHVRNLPRLLDDSEELLCKQLRQNEQQRNWQLMNLQQTRKRNGAPPKEKRVQPPSNQEVSAKLKEPVPTKQPNDLATGANPKSAMPSEGKRGSVISASQASATDGPRRKSEESIAEAVKRGQQRIIPKPPTPPPISPTPKSDVGQGNQARKSSSSHAPTQQQESIRKSGKNIPGPPPSPPPPTQPIKHQVENRTAVKGPISNTGKTDESKQTPQRKPSVDDGASTASKSKSNMVSHAAPNLNPAPSAEGAGSNSGNNRSGKKKSSTKTKVSAQSEPPTAQGTYIGKRPRAPFALRRRRFRTIKPTDWVCAFCDYEHSLWLESEYPQIQKSIKKKQRMAAKARKAGAPE